MIRVIRGSTFLELLMIPPLRQACARDFRKNPRLLTLNVMKKLSSVLFIKKLSSVLFIIAFAAAAFAEGTRQWKETGYDDFERGTARGVAIRSTGQIELAPAFKAIYTSPSTFIWSIAADKDGVVYAATGAPARVYRVTPDGKSTIIFEPKELQVQAIALGQDGAVYAATSPDGKVYKITRKPGG